MSQNHVLKMSFLLVFFILIALQGCGGGGGDSNGVVTEDPDQPAAGLTERPSNQLCMISTFNQPESEFVQLSDITPELSYDRPLLLLPHPSQTNVVYVVEQGGIVYRVDLDSQTRSVLVDLAQVYSLSQCGECGLLGMALHPDFLNNGQIYLSFTEDVAGDMVTVVARFESPDSGVSLNIDTEDPLMRQDIFSVTQTFSNHNGGHISFGPDGFLYLGLGDGGSGNDPLNDAQDVSTLLGAMIRLTDDGSPAPDNNVSGALPEIYAYGLRNPWRWSFDRMTGDLWLGDVGQGQYEEINIINAGENYGWRCFEGLHRTANSCTSQGPYTDPVFEYDHTEGNSVTGGYVYRGTQLPSLTGKYLFSDFGSGTVWTLSPDGNGGYTRETLLESGLNIASFGEDLSGELYVVSFSGIYRLEQASGNTNGAGIPTLLSETGCASEDVPQEPVEGMIPFTLVEPFWSDGAAKQRYMAVPDDQQVSVASDGDFDWPVGTVLRKDFLFDSKFIETRLFMHMQPQQWQGYSYRWNETQTDAQLVTQSEDVDIQVNGELQHWHFPSESECLQCHTEAAGFSLGPELRQLNTEQLYPGGVSANQLVTLDSIGLFEVPLTMEQKALTMSASTSVESTPEERARSYLHVNCSGCHRPGGTSQSNIDFRITTPMAATHTCDAEPLNGDLGIINARILVPRNPGRSLLYQRMLSTDSSAMPPLSRHVVDEEGAALMADWIDSFNRCE